MKIIVCGAGQIGHNLVRYLSEDNHEVVVIDQSENVIDKLSEELDIQAIVGQSSHPDVLKNAGAKNTDLIIAVPGSDEVNMLICQVAQSIFNIPIKIARIRDQGYLNTEWSSLFEDQNIGIDYVISPEMEIAKAISRNINISGAFDIHSLADEEIMFAGIHVLENSNILRTPLHLIPAIIPNLQFALAIIVRNAQVIFPQKDDILLPQDEVYVLCPKDHLEQTSKELGHLIPPFKRVLIMGGGHIGVNLASLIENRDDLKTKIIERNFEQAQSISKLLKFTHVFHGTVLDGDLLQEANIGSTEIAISVTNDDKVNILSSLLAKKLGARRTFSIINDINYNPLINSLGVDGVINPKNITISSILHFLRTGRIKSMQTLRDGIADILEIDVLETSPIVGCFVNKINVSGAIHILAIKRNNVFIFSPNNITIQNKDHLIMIIAPHTLHRIEKLFFSRADYI